MFVLDNINERWLDRGIVRSSMCLCRGRDQRSHDVYLLIDEVERLKLLNDVWSGMAHGVPNVCTLKAGWSLGGIWLDS